MMLSADSRVAGVQPGFASTALRAGRPLAPALARQVSLIAYQFFVLCSRIAFELSFGFMHIRCSEPGAVASSGCHLPQILQSLSFEV